MVTPLTETNIRKTESLFWSFIRICCFFADCKQGLHFFEKFQDIPTKGAAAVKFFSIGDELFLVFANCRGDNLQYKAKSVVYKMENGRFVEKQTLSTYGAFGIDHFVIDKVHYMAIANSYDGSQKQNSVIYKCRGGKFEDFQLISTHGATGLKFFTIEGEHYLAVAETSDGSTQLIDSFVYKWKKGRFVKYQNIPTVGAHGCDSIVIANQTYLVYANHYHPQKKYIIDSNVYKWSGGHFLKFKRCRPKGHTAQSSFVSAVMSFSPLPTIIQEATTTPNHQSTNGMVQSLLYFKRFLLVVLYGFAPLK